MKLRCQTIDETEALGPVGCTLPENHGVANLGDSTKSLVLVDVFLKASGPELVKFSAFIFYNRKVRF